MAKIGINLATASLQKPDLTVGIDAGTTNGLVAVVPPGSGHPIVLRETDGLAMVPAVIYFGPEGQVIVGEGARDFLVSDPGRTVYSTRRLLGRSSKDLDSRDLLLTFNLEEGEKGKPLVQIGNRFYSPVELFAMMLKELKSRAEHLLKTPVKKAVITVPAYFNDGQRRETQEAATLAGFEAVKLMNEPTAAGLAYGAGKAVAAQRTLAIFDLGGGTFDFSILKITNGISEVLSTQGHSFLGGDDFDRLVIHYWVEAAGLDEKALSEDKALLQELRLSAEKAKQHLSEHYLFATVINGETFTISRLDFEHLVAPLIEKTIDRCRQALQDVMLSPGDIDEIIMVGASTRIPAIRQAVSDFFEKELTTEVNPEEIVALGAAIQANTWAGQNAEPFPVDITAFGIGIEHDGTLKPVIAKNEKLPAAATITLEPSGQPGGRIEFRVYQSGNGVFDTPCTLAACSLNANGGPVEIRFQVNTDGILELEGFDLTSGKEILVEIKSGKSNELQSGPASSTRQLSDPC